MPKNPQIIIPKELHTDVKIEVAKRNEVLPPTAKRFRMEDAVVEAFKPWFAQSRSHRKLANQKTEKLSIA